MIYKMANPPTVSAQWAWTSSPSVFSSAQVQVSIAQGFTSRTHTKRQMSSETNRIQIQYIQGQNDNMAYNENRSKSIVIQQICKDSKKHTIGYI